MTKIFLTGATGYVGGSLFVRLLEAYPEFEITVLLRQIPEDFEKKYPNVKIVIGAWETPEVLTRAASEADIVLHCGDSDNYGAVEALLNGCVMQNRKVFYIHLSGTGLLSDYQDSYQYRGKLNPAIHSDVDDIDWILSRPMERLHAPTDKLIQKIGEKYKEAVKTAIIAPPSIHGRGTGPGRTDTYYFPLFIPEVKKHGFTMYTSEGSNRKGWVHIQDLIDVYMLLINRAVIGGEGVSWGKHGYFLTTTMEATQLELATVLGKILHKRGVIESPEPKQVSEDFIGNTLTDFKVKDFGYYMLASNSRGKADRAVIELGWKGRQHPTLWDTIEVEVDDFLNKPGYVKVI